MHAHIFRIDASMEDGSFGRLINDSEKDYNIRPKSIKVDGNPCVAFFATRDIKKGVEITYNYGKSSNYWWRHQEKELPKENKKNNGSTISSTIKMLEGSHKLTLTSEPAQQGNHDSQDLTEECRQVVDDSEHAMKGNLGILQHSTIEDQHSASRFDNSEQTTPTKHGTLQDLTEDSQHPARPVDDSRNSTHGTHGTLHGLTEKCQQFESTGDNSKQLTQRKHGTLQHLPEECHQFAGAADDYDNATQGKHGTLQDLTEGCQQPASTTDRQNGLQELHDAGDNTEEMDAEKESTTFEEELDNDMDEDYSPGPDASTSEEDSDSSPESTANEASCGNAKNDDAACHENTQEKNPPNEQRKQSSLQTDREGCQADHTNSLKNDDHYQKITIQPTSNTSGMRNWDKKYFCLFCDKGFAKLPQHLMGQHKEEPLIIEIELEKDPRVRKEKLAKLRNIGNHKHNCDVLRNGEGVLIVGYRPQGLGPVSPKDYGPCGDCLVYLTRTNLWKHRCPAKGTNPEEEAAKRKRPAMAAKLMVPTPTNISPEVHRLLLGLIDDEIGRVIKGDSLLVELAKYEYLEHGHDRDQHGDIRATLRRMGRLLIQLRRDTKESGSLAMFLDGKHFTTVVEAARQVGAFDENSHRYLKASTAIKIGHTLKRLAMIVKGKAMENQDTESRSRAEDFLELYQMNWTHEVSRHAHRTLHENKRNKVRILPLTEDIMLLSQYLKKTTERCVQELQGTMNQAAWVTLNKVMLARIIVLNRRRSGESAKIKVEEFQERPRPNGDKVVMEGLSNVEQELCRSLERIEIRGKRGSNVPVLLTEEMVNAIDILIERRNETGVNSANEFLFARANYGSLDHIRGCDCLRELAKEAGCKNPSIMRSTPLRKQIATVSQIINLKENELDILAKFLGHDIRVHREFYRLPQETLQVAKVSKLLLASEQGMHGLEGKTLDEIDIGVDEGE